MEPDAHRAFTRFVKETEPRLSYALAAYGLEVGAEATADALVWAWSWKPSMTPTARSVPTRKRRSPVAEPTVLIVVLAVALVGLIAWMVFMMRPNSPTAASPEIVQLMEDYNAAWNAHDAMRSRLW